MIATVAGRKMLVSLCMLVLMTHFSSCTAYRQSIIGDQGIYYFQRVEIGGLRQPVMIRGQDKDNPVMVFLHGGPGFPLFPVDPVRGVMRHLEKDFTMVYWEQRGTGASFDWQLIRDPVRVDDLVGDIGDLISFVRELLGVEKVFLWGHSWGSNIGVKYAAKNPGHLHGYLATGQSVNPLKNERLCYDFVVEKARRENNRRALRDMERIDTIPENYSLRDALLVRKWVYRYGGVVKDAESSTYIDPGYIVNTLTAPQYTLRDRLRMVAMPYFAPEQLWEDLKGIDLFETVPRIDVPVFFLLGRYDVIVSSELAAQYFHHLEAPSGKELIWFENSAHRPHREEKEMFLEVVRSRILPLANQ